jgi:hypothetical protein
LPLWWAERPTRQADAGADRDEPRAARAALLGASSRQRRARGVIHIHRSMDRRSRARGTVKWRLLPGASIRGTLRVWRLFEMSVSVAGDRSACRRSKGPVDACLDTTSDASSRNVHEPSVTWASCRSLTPARRCRW